MDVGQQLILPLKKNTKHKQDKQKLWRLVYNSLTSKEEK